jgi:hypothetical protein
MNAVTEAGNEFDPRRNEVLSAVESRLSMLKSKLVGATAAERDEIIRDILACESLCRRLDAALKAGEART